MKKQKKKKNKFKKHLPEIIYGTCCVAVFSTMAFSIWHFLIKPDAQQVNINAPETPTTKIYAEVTATVPTETIQTIQTSETQFTTTAETSATTEVTTMTTQETTETTVPKKTTAEKILADMSIEEKVGQMFLIRTPRGYEDFTEYKAGGYIMFAVDFDGRTPTDIQNLLSDFQQNSEVPMIIAVDEEGGYVNRVSKFPQFRDTPFSSPQKLFAQGGFEAIKNDATEKAQLLKSLGINVNLAPVCDVSVNENDYIHGRSLGQDAEQTAIFAETVVKEMNNQGMGSVLKHFPGYGNNSDTHTGIVYDSRPYSTFLESDFVPFKAGIKAGCGCVMVSHNIVSCIDEKYPASLSSKVHQTLRKELNFDGVVMTDDLCMEAITQYTDGRNTAVLAIEAGNDMLISTDFVQQIPAVIDAVNSGEISEDRIDRSVLRILNWKISLGIIK